MVKVQETDILESPERLKNVFKSAISSITPLGGLLDNLSFQMSTQTMYMLLCWPVADMAEAHTS